MTEAVTCDCTPDDFCLHRATPYDDGEIEMKGWPWPTVILTWVCALVLVVTLFAIALRIPYTF